MKWCNNLKHEAESHDKFLMFVQIKIKKNKIK